MRIIAGTILTLSAFAAAQTTASKPIEPVSQPAMQPAGPVASVQTIDDLTRKEAWCLKYPDIKGPLSARLKVRDQADTLDELIAKAKPTFLWRNDPREMSSDHGLVNLLWIDETPGCDPVFRLETPFTLEQDGQKTRWVLLDMQGGDNDQQFMNQTSNKFMPARIEVVPDKPEYDRGYRNYAIVKSHNKQGGNVYEIGWFAWSGGTGRWEYLRVFYLWQDAKKKWRIIGEGPEESMGRYSGWEFGGKSVESEIEWKDQPIHPIIKFVQIESHSEACEQPSGLPGIHSRRDAILEISDGAKPGKLRWLSDRPYIMAQKGDTLEKIAQDRAAWSMAHYSAKNPAEEMQRQEKIRNAWFKALVFLNPEISKKDVSAGDRINLPTSTEIAASLQAKTQPAGQ